VIRCEPLISDVREERVTCGSVLRKLIPIKTIGLKG
jgi:hypothetical protein